MFRRAWGQSYAATMLYICKSVDMAVVVTRDTLSPLDTSPAREVLESLNGLHRSWTLIAVRKRSCSTSRRARRDLSTRPTLTANLTLKALGCVCWLSFV